MSVWSGFFPAGVGLLFLHIYLLFFGLTMLETKGTDKIPGLFSDIGAIMVFTSAGAVNLLYIASFFPGMVLGGMLGAKAAIFIGDRHLKTILIISALAMVAVLLMKR